MISLSKACWCNCCFTTLNTFSMGLQSGLWGGMLNTLTPILSIGLFACLLFLLGSPSWRNNLPWGLALLLNVCLKYIFINFANYSLLMCALYCLQRMTPLLYAMATKNLATCPPEPQCKLLAVQPGISHLSCVHQAIVFIDFTSSCRLYLCWKPALPEWLRQ